MLVSTSAVGACGISHALEPSSGNDAVERGRLKPDKKDVGEGTGLGLDLRCDMVAKL